MMNGMNIIVILLAFVNFALSGLPTNGYAPGFVACPEGKLNRDANGLSSEEAKWMASRHRVTSGKLSLFLKNANMLDIDIDSFLSLASKPITIGQAFSGGGYRAMLAGAGQLSALDERTMCGTKQGPLKGLLQASSYVTGLSGGSWLVGSVAMSDFKSVDEILRQNKNWDIIRSILDPKGINFFANYLYFATVGGEISTKLLSGFPITITDIWARFLSYQLLEEFRNEGAATTFNDIESLPSFSSFQMPFPILSSVNRMPHTFEVNADSMIFELTPYEIGSWDSRMREFFQGKYVGTWVDDGSPKSNVCRTGFNNVGFFMATSSSLFNSVLQNCNLNMFPPILRELAQNIIINPITDMPPDVSRYWPNPFYSSSKSSDNAIAKNDSLFLVDGGEDGQNVPLYPLLQKERGVDIIFAHDNSADVNNYPDGTSLIATYTAQFGEKGKLSPFPYVPGQSSFLNLNLTAKPTFFGCNASNLSTLTDNIYDVPLVVYMPNRPFSYWSNTSTFKLTYTDAEKRGMIANGYETESRKNGTLDAEWAACVGCAIIRREQERQGLEQTEQCKKCFQRYCWDGTTYEGPGIGENFSDDGRQVSAEFYNSQNVAGINDGGISLFKRDSFRSYPISTGNVELNAFDEEQNNIPTFLKGISI